MKDVIFLGYFEMLMHIYVLQHNLGLLFHEQGSKLLQGGSSMQVDHNFNPSTFIQGGGLSFRNFRKKGGGFRFFP